MLTYQELKKKKKKKKLEMDKKKKLNDEEHNVLMYFNVFHILTAGFSTFSLMLNWGLMLGGV